MTNAKPSSAAILLAKLRDNHAGRTVRAFPYAGMTSTTSPNAYIAFLNSLAYRAVMIATCAFLSFALGYVPGIGGVAETIFFCWVNA